MNSPVEQPVFEYWTVVLRPAFGEWLELLVHKSEQQNNTSNTFWWELILCLRILFSVSIFILFQYLVAFGGPRSSLFKVKRRKWNHEQLWFRPPRSLVTETKKSYDMNRNVSSRYSGFVVFSYRRVTVGSVRDRDTRQIIERWWDNIWDLYMTPLKDFL